MTRGAAAPTVAYMSPASAILNLSPAASAPPPEVSAGGESDFSEVLSQGLRESPSEAPPAADETSQVPPEEDAEATGDQAPAAAPEKESPESEDRPTEEQPTAGVAAEGDHDARPVGGSEVAVEDVALRAATGEHADAVEATQDLPSAEEGLSDSPSPEVRNGLAGDESPEEAALAGLRNVAEDRRLGDAEQATATLGKAASDEGEPPPRRNVERSSAQLDADSPDSKAKPEALPTDAASVERSSQEEAVRPVLADPVAAADAEQGAIQAAAVADRAAPAEVELPASQVAAPSHAAGTEESAHAPRADDVEIGATEPSEDETHSHARSDRSAVPAARESGNEPSSAIRAGFAGEPAEAALHADQQPVGEAAISADGPLRSQEVAAPVRLAAAVHSEPLADVGDRKAAAAGPGEAAAPPLTGAQRGRFVQRVAGAVAAAAERGGPLRLRLNPPELGGLKLEVRFTEAGLDVRMEAETPAARAALLDNLPSLRDKLAGQEVKIERFDVDLMNQRDSSPRDGYAQDSDRKDAAPERRPAIDVQRASPRESAPNSAASSSLVDLIA